LQSRPAAAANYQRIDYGLGESYVDKHQPYPDQEKGARTPNDLSKYDGKGKTSYGTTE
jgi:hypothetical protein